MTEEQCQHVDYADTLDGAVCNDCGKELTNYEVVITETLSRTIIINAATSDEAIERASAMYSNQEIVLDYNDMVTSPNIEVIN